jgi:hypothetical protein
MAISNTLNASRSINGIPVWGTDFPEKAKKFKLTANTIKALTIPEGNWNLAVVTTSSGASVQVSPTSEALPTGVDWEDTHAQMQKSVINLEGLTTLYFVSPNDDYVYVAFSRNLMV